MKAKVCALLIAGALVATMALAEDDAVQHDRGMQAGDLAPRGLQPAGSASQLVVNVVTEVTAAGKAAPQAAPDRTVAYEAHDGGAITVGDVIGGERNPAPAVLAGTLKTALAANGYVWAGQGERPGILIFYRWGSYNREPRGFPELERINLVERAALVGGMDFGMDVARAIDGGMLGTFSHKDPKTELLMDQAQSDLYFLVASAYDLPAAERGERVLLWRTFLSTRSRGVTMEESLPALVAEAGPYFGHATAGSVRIETRLPEGKVEIGQPIVKEYFAAPLPSGFKPDPSALQPIPPSQIPEFPLAR